MTEQDQKRAMDYEQRKRQRGFVNELLQLNYKQDITVDMLLELHQLFRMQNHNNLIAPLVTYYIRQLVKIGVDDPLTVIVKMFARDYEREIMDSVYIQQQSDMQQTNNTNMPERYTEDEMIEMENRTVTNPEQYVGTRGQVQQPQVPSLEALGGDGQLLEQLEQDNPNPRGTRYSYF